MILDPTNVQPRQITGSIRKRDVPSLTPKQLAFGFLPNIERIKPGYLLLTQSIGKGGTFEFAIREAQKLQFSERYEWTHAAIYAQTWRVIEATPENNVSDGDLMSCKHSA